MASDTTAVSGVPLTAVQDL